VCIVEIDHVHPNGFEFRTARVIGHGKTRRAPVEQAMAWRDHYDLIGHYFTGRITVRTPRPSLILDDETRDAIRYRRGERRDHGAQRVAVRRQHDLGAAVDGDEQPIGVEPEHCAGMQVELEGGLDAYV
jgi:hypothetical protein